MNNNENTINQDERHVLSILVNNESGVLARLAGLFSRRCYNIDSLSVGTTEDENVSRITVAVKVKRDEDSACIVDQILKQIQKQYCVIRAVTILKDISLFKELMMVKVKATPQTRSDIVNIANVFHANIEDVSIDSVIIEITGDTRKQTAFIDILRPFGILEIVRTGLTAIQRGGENVIKKQKEEIC